MQSNLRLKQVTSFCASLALACVVTASLSGCTKPRQTTAIGSGVGGAIGAGLGAIVGNQSGNAGSGLAIGAGAGAAVGALVGNALQAQEERNTTQDEAIKRQERVIQAQRNEINELRAIRGDDSFSVSPSAQTPRYRYRTPTTDPESPEVARQRAKLQQRGPTPRGGSGAIYSQSYYSYPSSRTRAATAEVAPAPQITTTPRNSKSVATPPAATLPSVVAAPAAREQHKPLARYDVRSELSAGASESTNSSASKLRESAPPVEPRQVTPPQRKDTAVSITESDIAAPNPKTESTSRATSATPASAPQTKECKEALAERDLAAESTESSDKLFHLRRALRLCPQSAPLHHELGKVYASMQRGKDAEEEFKQALSIDPSFSAAKRELGSLLKEEVHF